MRNGGLNPIPGSPIPAYSRATTEAQAAVKNDEKEDRMIRRARLLAIAFALAVLAPVLVAAAPVHINFWHIGTAATDKAFYQSVMDAYMKAHPDVIIDVTILENEAFKSKLTTVMQAGTPPDVFHSWGGGVMAEYAKAGLLRDITSYVQGTDWGNSMAPGVWQVYQYNGRQYGAPFHHVLVQQGPPGQGGLHHLPSRLGCIPDAREEAEGRRHHPHRVGRR